MYVSPSIKYKIKCNNFPTIWLLLFKSKLFKHDVGIVYNIYYVIVMDGNLNLYFNIEFINC